EVVFPIKTCGSHKQEDGSLSPHSCPAATDRSSRSARNDQVLSTIDAVLGLSSARVGVTLLLAAPAGHPIVHHPAALRTVGDGRVWPPMVHVVAGHRDHTCH